ncbi:hypothetical protein [Actinoplanes sp. NPDC049599]|uniref:hypothetical protein n=1 Tax=Actinoplanes sp. NPDC049599 TaxID=3363903 RepID=UPI0037AEC754
MTFPLEELASQVATRAEAWTRLGLVWRTQPISPNHGKPVVSSEFESAAWLAEIMIWSTGEAELETVRVGDDRIVNKHYDLISRDELATLLDEFVALLVEDRIPDGAFVGRWPE